MVTIPEIVAGLKKPGKSKKGLAAQLGRQPSMVTALLKGERQLKASEVSMVEDYLELDRTIPIVGVVGAGGEANFLPPGELGRAKGWRGASPHTVAVEIRGTSLGTIFDGWVAFYDDVRSPVTPDLIGQLCVVGLVDGSIMVKMIRRALADGRFHLASSNGDPIYDAEIEWAARVIDIKPRDVAVA